MSASTISTTTSFNFDLIKRLYFIAEKLDKA